VLGKKAPDGVTINEMTTVASLWTRTQFLDGSAIKGHALSLKIAAGKRIELRRPSNRRMGTAIRLTAARRR